jgi:hypothetical protein
MAGISNERKQEVLRQIYNIVESCPSVKKYNLPIWIDDWVAAQSLVGEEILENNPHNDDKDCYRAGPKFEEGLKKYGITIELGAIIIKS